MTRPFVRFTLGGALCAFALLAPGCGEAAHSQKVRREAQDRYDRAGAQIVYDQARQSFHSGQFEQALEHADRAIVRFPKDSSYHLLRGRILHEMMRVEDARDAFARSAELDPKKPEPHYFMGIIHQRWREDGRAIECYAKAAELEPSKLHFSAAEVEMLTLAGRHDDAEARLAGEGLTPPSYYLDYGGKYCTAFTKDLRPKLSPEGQAWCDATALALQDAIESHRAADPLGYVTLEKDDAAFTKFAFETHPDAYLNSGLDELAQGTCCSSGPRRRSPTSWVQAGSCRWSTLGCGSSRCGRRSLASSTRKTLRRSTGCSSTRTPRSSGRSRRDTSLQRSSRGRSSRSSTGCSAMARWCDCSTKRASSCKTAPRARRTPLDGCWSSKA